MILLIALLTSYIVFEIINKKSGFVVDLPYSLAIEDKTTLSCQGVLSSNILSKLKDLDPVGVRGEISKGTDKIAIEIKDEATLKFLTAASVGAGVTEGDDWVIVHNTNESLTAILQNGLSGDTNVFTLNKNNGFAIWTKNRPSFLTDEVPSNESIFLSCI